MAGSVAIGANLIILAAQHRPVAPPGPDTPLTPEEEQTWADLVARLAPRRPNV